MGGGGGEGDRGGGVGGRGEGKGLQSWFYFLFQILFSWQFHFIFRMLCVCVCVCVFDGVAPPAREIPHGRRGIPEFRGNTSSTSGSGSLPQRDNCHSIRTLALPAIYSDLLPFIFQV